MVARSNIIWINENTDNEENKAYLNQLENLDNFNIKSFTNVQESITQIKSIKFERTFIIVSGGLYIEFIQCFSMSLSEIYVIPKLIIFESNKQNFFNYNKEFVEILSNKFYNYGGIKTSFNEIYNFILNESNIENKLLFNDNDYENYVFEYIDSKEQLLLPLFYKTCIDITPNDKIETFSQYLYNKYGNKSEQIKALLDCFINMKDIPLELISKYYSRMYTNEDSHFYSELNKDLRENKKDKYLPYIKALYEGIKSKSLKISNNDILYRGSSLSKEEISKIKKYINQKKENLPSSIVFSKMFLSFTKDQEVAYRFLNGIKNDDNNLFKVLFEVEKDENFDYTLATNIDMEELSYFSSEKEVLFLPFSSFEVKSIKEIFNNDEKIYLIKLKYLGKYLKKLKTDAKLKEKIPNSKFFKEISDFGLINRNNIGNMNQKDLFKKYDNFKKSKPKPILSYSRSNNNCNIIQKELPNFNLDINQIIQNVEFNKLTLDDIHQKFKTHQHFKNLLNIKKIQRDVIMGGYKLSLDMLDARGNKYFNSSSINKIRGGRIYNGPIGWIGIGLNVTNKYENNNWFSNDKNLGVWCIGYHGVGKGLISAQVKAVTGIIIKNTFKSTMHQAHEDCEDINHQGNKVGNGVYFSNNIETAELYSGISEIDGKKYKTVLMVRIRPDAIRECNCNDAIGYYIVNGTIDEVRPYRILYKKVDKI